jgi:chromate reductase, NAD(P)H dehydrogenase (quinone)
VHRLRSNFPFLPLSNVCDAAAAFERRPNVCAPRPLKQKTLIVDAQNHLEVIPMPARNVAVLVGSLRKESLNRRMAHALSELATQDLKLDIVEIGGLPLYNQDLDASPPQPWREFRDRIRAADAALFVTPEYNRSIPAPLKNAIDVGSRPYGSSVWDGKPGAVVSVSPSAIGGFGANHHLRQCFVFLNVPVMQQPEAYIGGADKLFEGGKLVNDSTRQYLTRFLQAFAAWIEHNAKR